MERDNEADAARTQPQSDILLPFCSRHPGMTTDLVHRRPFNMTTLEELFAPVIELKDAAIEQMQQQADSYTQQLATRFSIDGITPPPSSNCHSSNPNGETGVEGANLPDFCLGSHASKKSRSGKAQGTQSKNKPYCGRVTRSRCSSQQISGTNKSSNTHTSVSCNKKGGGSLSHSVGDLMHKLNVSNELLDAVKTSHVLSERNGETQVICRDGGVLKPVISSNTDMKRSSPGGNHQENAEILAGNGPIDAPVVMQPVNSGSKLDPLTFDCCTKVKPKHHEISETRKQGTHHYGVFIPLSQDSNSLFISSLAKQGNKDFEVDLGSPKSGDFEVGTTLKLSSMKLNSAKFNTCPLNQQKNVEYQPNCFSDSRKFRVPIQRDDIRLSMKTPENGVNSTKESASIFSSEKIDIYQSDGIQSCDRNFPMVQQKQADAVCTGKRDINVKALEAAEAEELKKKEADIAARKLEKSRAMKAEIVKYVKKVIFLSIFVVFCAHCLKTYHVD